MFQSFIVAIALFLWTGGLVAQSKEPAVVVKKLVGLIRYKKYDNAIKLIDIKTFSKNLLPSDYEGFSDADKLKFEEAVKGYIIAKAFPLALKYFGEIDINYEKATMTTNGAKIGSDILYKGSERVKIAWILSKKGEEYLVSDFVAENKLATEVNNKRLEPIYKKKGINGLIQAIEEASK
jgi:ABC-type transporter MlaC component